MTADGESGKRARSHHHTIYWSAADRALIARRAEEAGMSFTLGASGTPGMDDFA